MLASSIILSSNKDELKSSSDSGIVYIITGSMIADKKYNSDFLETN